MIDYRFTLPLPPSVNTMYAHDKKTGRRFKTKVLKEWIDEAKYSIKAPQHCFNSEIEVFYSFFFQNNRKRDVENYVKALSDFLVSSYVIKDDSLIVKMTLHKIIDKDYGRVEGLVRYFPDPLDNETEKL